MSKGHRSPRTAGEVLAELEQNPEYIERQRARLAERAANRRRYAEAADGLLRDLGTAGFEVETVAQLRPGGRETRPALPALLHWLPLISYTPLKRDVLATLGSSWARPEAAPALIEEFWRIDPADDPGNLRWAVCDALERVSDDSVADALIEIATDARHGDQRSLAVAALGRMRKRREDVIPVLMQLLADDDVAAYAIKALTKLKAHGARAEIQRLESHRHPWVRQEAKRALAKLPPV